jgi:hypothetical protein
MSACVFTTNAIERAIFSIRGHRIIYCVALPATAFTLDDSSTTAPAKST